MRNPKVTIVDVPDIAVALLEHHGHPDSLDESIQDFIAWRKESGLTPDVSATYNIFYNDPDMESDDGIVPSVIPGGRCAVLRVIGSGDNLADAADYLYDVWLFENDVELRDFPMYCQRVKFGEEVREQDTVTDLFLPVV
jgi:AraC family transcriptional regulator